MKQKEKNKFGGELENFTELSETANPKTVVIYRKTKAGNWEKLQSHWYRQGYKSMCVSELCNNLHWAEAKDYVTINNIISPHDRFISAPYKVAYKAKTVKGKQIYSTEYTEFLEFLLVPECEGIMVNKTNFIPKDRIARWLKELSANHDGIKNWKKSAFCKEDNYLIWGYLICNDGHREKVAIIGLNGNQNFVY